MSEVADFALSKWKFHSKSMFHQGLYSQMQSYKTDHN